MTSNPKWAFAQQVDAASFIKAFGGKLAKIDQVQQTVTEELAQEKR